MLNNLAIIVKTSFPLRYRYMTDALPLLKGSPEALEAAMLLVLKRVNKMFEKLVNKPDLMVRTTGVEYLNQSLSFILLNLFYCLYSGASTGNPWKFI